MGSYNVILSENAYKDLKKIHRLKLPQQQVSRIFKAIKSLEDDPRPPGCKKLEQTAMPLYRIRVGRRGYRIIYQIDDASKTVDVLYIRHRRTAYRIVR
jgi:mRNA interferase RelE/StbE